MFVWMSFSSFGYLTRNSRHVRVGFLVGKIKESVQKKILFLCDVLFLVFSAAGLKAVISLCIDAAKYQDKLMAIPWNYNVLYLAGVLGFLMMVIRNIQILIWKIRNWNAELERFINYDGVYYENNKVFCEREGKGYGSRYFICYTDCFFAAVCADWSKSGAFIIGSYCNGKSNKYGDFCSVHASGT